MMAVIDSLQISELSNVLTSKQNAVETLENFLPLLSLSHQQLDNHRSHNEELVAKSLLPIILKSGSLSVHLVMPTVLFNSASILIFGN